MLLVINETFNGQRTYRVNFRWVKVLSAPAAIDVRWGRGGAADNEWMGMVSGEGFRARAGADDFGFLQITNSGSQTVRVQVGDEESFSDSVLGTVDVSDRAARLLGIAYGNLGQLAQKLIGSANVLETSDRGYIAGVNFASEASLASGTNESVLSPASNIAGVIVWRAGIITAANVANNAAQICLLAKSSAPASGVDGELLFRVCAYIGAITADPGLQMGQGVIERPRFVSAGKGIYFRNSGNTEPIGSRYLDYTVL